MMTNSSNAASTSAYDPIMRLPVFDISYFFLQHNCHHSFSCCQPPVLQSARKIRTGWKKSRMRRAWSVSRPKAEMWLTYWLMLPGKITT